MNEPELTTEEQGLIVDCVSLNFGPEIAAKLSDSLASAPAATQVEAVSPMAKMAQALRGKALAERAAFDTRVQSGEWGPMPDAGTEADCPNAHVATIEGDDAVRQMRWNPNVAAFDYEVGTKLYAAPTPQPTAPARAVEAQGGACRGERCLASQANGYAHSRECIVSAGRGQGWVPTAEELAQDGPSAPGLVPPDAWPNTMALIAAAFEQTGHAQGTPINKAFVAGSRWTRRQVLEAEATQPAAAEQPTMDQVHAALRAANLMLVRTVHGLQVVPALKDAVAAQAPAGVEAAQQGRPCTCHPDDSPPNPCAKRYALTECKAAAQAATERDPRDEEAWQALGFLSGLHGCMTIDGDQPMKMAEAIFEHVQGEIKQWRDEAERCRAELVNLAAERGELARWKMNQAAQKSHPQEGRMQ